MKPALVISKGTELFRFLPESILYISASGNYSFVYTVDGRNFMISLQLGKVEELLASQLGGDAKIFVRIGRTFIINTDYINSIDISEQKLLLSDCMSGQSCAIYPSRDALIHLRDYIVDQVSKMSSDPDE